MISHSGKVLVLVSKLMDSFVRRSDGSESSILADIRFDNHNKMTITGVVIAGTDTMDVNPLEDFDNKMPRTLFKPVGYRYNNVFKNDLRKGDQVFFHYLCAEDKTMMSRASDGQWQVLMSISDIFCFKRDGVMHMNHNWVLGYEPEPVPEFVDVNGVKIRGSLNPTHGVDLFMGNIASPFVDEAIISQIDDCSHNSNHEEVKAGDHVYLAKDSMFVNVIDNKNSLLFRHSDIVAVKGREVKDTIPVGNQIMLKVSNNDYRSEIIKGATILRAPEYGIVFRTGKRVTNVVTGDKIIFSRRWTKLLDREYYLIPDGEVQATIEN